MLVHSDPLISAIYADAQTRMRKPRHLEQMIKTLDQIDWFSVQKDGLGDLYEGLLEKNASEAKSGAGQYFTPRALINSMVQCIAPQPSEVIQDPAADTAGFLVAADQFMREQTDDYFSLKSAERTFQAKLNTRLSLFAGRPSVQHNPLRLPALRSGSSGPSASISAVAGFTWRALCGVTLSR